MGKRSKIPLASSTVVGVPVLVLLLAVPLLLGMGEAPPSSAVTLNAVAAGTEPVDPRLLGKWRTSAAGELGAATLELRRSPTFLDHYEVVMPWYFARPVDGRIVSISTGTKNEPLIVLECSIRVRAEDTGLLIPARHYFGIRLEGGRIHLSLLSVELGYMAQSGRGAVGAHWVRDLETVSAGPVAVIVTDRDDLKNQLALAAKRIAPKWVLTFERER